jgi:hypothetical protein
MIKVNSRFESLRQKIRPGSDGQIEIVRQKGICESGIILKLTRLGNMANSELWNNKKVAGNWHQAQSTKNR